MKNFLLSISLLSLLLSSLVFSQDAGKSGLSFLKIGSGGKYVAMGDIGAVAADDASAIFYNPSRLSLNNQQELLLAHTEWIQDVNSEIIGVKFNLLGLPFGTGFNVTTVSDIEVRTKPGEAETVFNANYFFGSLSTAFSLQKNLSIGVSVKLIYESILVDEASGVGYDIGAAYYLNDLGLSFSAVVRNLGSMSSLRKAPTELPSEIRAGVSYKKKINKIFDLISGAELEKYFVQKSPGFNLGAGITYDELFALRLGYRSGFESVSFTGGVGIILNKVSFDYALTPFSYDLGYAHTISLSIIL